MAAVNMPAAERVVSVFLIVMVSSPAVTGMVAVCGIGDSEARIDAAEPTEGCQAATKGGNDAPGGRRLASSFRSSQRTRAVRRRPSRSDENEKIGVDGLGLRRGH